MKLLTTAQAIIALGLVATPALAIDGLTKAALDAEGLKYTVDDDGDFKLTIGLNDGDRTQLVYVISRVETIATLGDIREVVSPVLKSDGPLTYQMMSTLLRANAATKIGAYRVVGDSARPSV